MSSVDERLSKLRQDRIAREKARIEKLRELNFKKYNKYEAQPSSKPFNTTISTSKLVKSEITVKNSNNSVKNNFHVNGTTKRPISAPIANVKQFVPNKELSKPKTVVNNIKTDVKLVNNLKTDVKLGNNINTDVKLINNVKTDVKLGNNINTDVKLINNVKTDVKLVPNVKTTKNIDSKPKITDKVVVNATKAIKTDNITSNVNKNLSNTNKPKFIPPKNDPKASRKSFAPSQPPKAFIKPSENLRKSMLPTKQVQNATKANPNRQSVFERLYQPKIAPKKQIDDVKKLQMDPNYLKKVIKDSGLILNRRHTVFDPKKSSNLNVRRSISAVHLKRISKSEMSNCIHKWSSIGDKLNNVHLEVNEDESIKEDKVVSAVKSERKKVKFQTPIPFNFNTPKPQELQSRLQNWLKKRGKSLDSYHHLQCFGIHHLPQREVLKPLDFDQNDDEDKENVPLESDSDDDSYTDNMNDRNNDFTKVMDSFPKLTDDKWRRVSSVSDSVDFNETQDSMMTPGIVDDLLVGALNDLTELLKEGLDWEQGARWLRAIRDRYPQAPNNAPYWECRAALEERRGDLTASVQCWEEAIAKGTERSVVEANLDQLLDKFMQLKISPNSGKQKQPDPKMVDIKNVFKSTLIRFAVQQAKLRRQSNQSSPPKYTVTPVRRSGRLSTQAQAPGSARRPLQLCASVQQAQTARPGPLLFVPNARLAGTP